MLPSWWRVGPRRLWVLPWQSLSNEPPSSLSSRTLPGPLCHVPFVCPIHSPACGAPDLWEWWSLLLLLRVQPGHQSMACGNKLLGFCLCVSITWCLELNRLFCSHNSLSFANQKPCLSRLRFRLFMAEVSFSKMSTGAFCLFLFLWVNSPSAP